ncbi:hypothetical protein K469DRAFT_753419 [Zopfia rhizophila CBS 207.26]|uniref:C2H2-type domain-containing protein n=1 Tax=Zopfia rhizophila CBS 207.26 TaxID=1314779 RepID=A0A6A6DPZ3_9PEZI|nr:hypothetical protein K469DRAFT_753419 [Zopfia rhizophila CBS 207.26]
MDHDQHFPPEHVQEAEKFAKTYPQRYASALLKFVYSKRTRRNSNTSSVPSINLSTFSRPSFTSSRTSLDTEYALSINTCASSTNTYADSTNVYAISNNTNSISPQPSYQQEPLVRPTPRTIARPNTQTCRPQDLHSEAFSSIPTPMGTPGQGISSRMDTPSEAFIMSPYAQTPVPEIRSPRLPNPSGPYFCTFCPDLRAFRAKSDWKKHETSFHETGEEWPCPVPRCYNVFDRVKDFERHFHRSHFDRQPLALTDIKIELLPREVFACGFEDCKEVFKTMYKDDTEKPEKAWDQRCDHVATHMKYGKTKQQWDHSNVIHNLLRQDATREVFDTLLESIDPSLKSGRPRIAWSEQSEDALANKNTRILRKKLECRDLRLNLDQVVLAALLLRSDLRSNFQLPRGFETPSSDSILRYGEVSREQRQQILQGTRTRLLQQQIETATAGMLTAVNAAHAPPLCPPPSCPLPPLPARPHQSGAMAYIDQSMNEPVGKRFSFQMDLDAPDVFPGPQPYSQVPMPLSTIDQQMRVAEEYGPGFLTPDHYHSTPDLNFGTRNPSTPTLDHSVSHPDPAIHPLHTAYPAWSLGLNPIEQSAHHSKPNILRRMIGHGTPQYAPSPKNQRLPDDEVWHTKSQHKKQGLHLAGKYWV